MAGSFAGAAVALLLAGTAHAAEIEGVNVPERAQIGRNGPELVLNGAGVRVRLVFNIYVAALYLPAKADDGEAILRAHGPSRLSLHLLRDLTAGQMISTTNDALQETLSPEERMPLESRLKQFNAVFETLRTLKKGTQIAIDHVPGSGTVVHINGEEKERIPGADFNQALLRMWIGDRPRDPDLRKALLGIGTR
jgi:Chalcone isomerase-like